MATAAELLANPGGHDDTTLVIDNYLRTIHIPKRITNLGVEYDDDVLRLNFRMPRYLDDTDLSTFAIRINYVNANGDGDIYTVSDKTVGSDSITFSWLVGPTATAYKGHTRFNVCMKIVDADGYVQREFNTAIAKLPVLEGLEVDEQVAAMYSDLIEQWKRELFGIGDTEEANMRAVSQEEQENIAQKGAEVLATIPEEYQETANAAQEGIRTKADAIVCTAEGNVITVSDSSDDHIRGLKIFGRTDQITTTGAQLFDGTKLSNLTGNGVTMTNDGLGRISLVGTATAAFSSVNIVIKDLSPGTYSVSGDIPGKVFFYVRVTLADGTLKYYKAPNVFTLDGTETEILGYLYAPQGNVSFNGDVVCPMLSKGDTALPWEPYSGGVVSPSPDWPQQLTSIEHPTVNVYGKNLFDASKLLAASGWTETDGTYSGMSSSIHALYNQNDGVPLITGFKENTQYTLSFYCRVENDSDKTAVTFSFKYNDGTSSFIYPGSVTGRNERIISTAGKTVVGLYGSYGSNLKVHLRNIQLEEGYAVTEYEPYSGGSIELNYTLPAIQVSSGGNYTDANGQQWVCDEIDFERGVYVQRIGEIVIDGAVVPTVFSQGTNGGTVFGFNYSDVGMDDILRNRCPKLCDRLLPMPDTTIASWKLCRIGHWCFNTDGSADNFLIMNVGECESAEAAQTWLKSNHITFQYILRTPIETPLSSTELEAFKELYTNHPNTTVFNDAGAWMELSYNADTKTYVDNGIKKTVAEVMEAIENGSY